MSNLVKSCTKKNEPSWSIEKLATLEGSHERIHFWDSKICMGSYLQDTQMDQSRSWNSCGVISRTTA